MIHNLDWVSSTNLFQRRSKLLTKAMDDQSILDVSRSKLLDIKLIKEALALTNHKPKSPASLIYLLVPTLSVSKFTNTLNSIVNTDGSYSDPALCHGIFSSACCVVMFLVVCPVCGLFLFLFNVNIILLDTLIFFFLWGNGGVGTHAVNSH